MKIPDISGPNAIGPSKGITPERTKPPKAEPREKPSPQKPTDRAEVVPERQEDARILQAARLVLDSLPDLREGKMELARRRLAEGFYDRPEVQGEIAGNILADPEIGPEPEELPPERAAEIKRRLAEGYYDQPDVQDRIARGLLDDATEE